MENPPASKFRWIAMATLLLAAFMELLDVTIVNVAIPSLQRDLHMTYATIQWMAAGYTLSFAVALVTGGRLGDIFGRKRIFMIGMSLFTVFSLLSGLAQSPEWLIEARLLQGLSAAMMMPQIMAYLVVLFNDQKERLMATGMYGGIAGLATVGGPLVGGILLENNVFGWDWRSIFFINIPVGIISLVLAWKFVPESQSPHPLKVDWLGMILLSGALLMLLFPLIQGRELDWPWWTFALMASSLPVLGLFTWYENYKTKKDGSPLVILSLFKERVFLAGLVIFIFFFGAMGAYFLLATLFLQGGLGFTPLQSGLTNIPFSIGVMLGAGFLVNVLVPKIGRNALILGALCLIAGFGYLIYILNVVGADITGWHMAPGYLLNGTGMGLVVASLFNFVLGGVTPSHAGSASGVLSTTQELGTSIGIAVIGVIFFSLIGTNANASADTVAPQIRRELSAMHVPDAAQSGIIKAFNVCFHDRANEKDPYVTPASCNQTSASPNLPPQLGQKIAAILKTAGTQANKDNFVATFRTTLVYQIAIFAVVALLIPILPKRAPDRLPEDATVM